MSRFVLAVNNPTNTFSTDSEYIVMQTPTIKTNLLSLLYTQCEMYDCYVERKVARYKIKKYTNSTV